MSQAGHQIPEGVAPLPFRNVSEAWKLRDGAHCLIIAVVMERPFGGVNEKLKKPVWGYVEAWYEAAYETEEGEKEAIFRFDHEDTWEMDKVAGFLELADVDAVQRLLAMKLVSKRIQ